MHHPEELLRTPGQVFALLDRQVRHHVDVLVLAGIAKALLEVQEKSGRDNLEDKENQFSLKLNNLHAG